MVSIQFDEILNKIYRLKITHLNHQGYGVASNLAINKRLKKNPFNYPRNITK